MELGILTFIERYTFPEYVAAVIIAVEAIKLFVKIPTIHPKWITLAVAIVFAVVHAIFFMDGGLTGQNFWKLLNSFGLAVLLYDYGIKPVKDLIKTRSVE